MEQQTQAMCSMLAMLRARARVSITTGRERTRLCHFNIRSQKQTGNSKLGLSSCRESHRQKEARRKAVCILREADRSLVKALLPQEPPFRVPPG